jgi:hypothetical protein
LNIAATKGSPSDGSSSGIASSGGASVECESPHADTANRRIGVVKDGKELSDVARQLHAIFSKELLLPPKGTKKIDECFGQNTIVLWAPQRSSHGTTDERVRHKQTGSRVFGITGDLLRVLPTLVAFTAFTAAVTIDGSIYINDYSVEYIRSCSMSNGTNKITGVPAQHIK